MKKLFLTITCLTCAIGASAQGYWNQGTQIMPLRVPTGERPEFMDLDGDGRQDAVKSYIYGDMA